MARGPTPGSSPANFTPEERAVISLQADNAVLHAQIEELSRKLEATEDKWTLLFGAMMEPPMGSPDGPSMYHRIKALVDGWERASWLMKWLVRVFWALPPLAGIIAVSWNYFKGPGQ